MSGLRKTGELPPLRLGPFHLRGIAGAGAMGEVWRADLPEAGVRAAVKIITARSARAREFHTLFAHEVRAVARLDHPAIIRLHDHGTISDAVGEATRGRLPAGAPWLAMEWLDGGALSDRRGQLDWPSLRQTLLVLLDGLAHAHARGLVHRDFKDGNVLMGPGGPVIADFGLAFDPTDAAPADERRVAGTPYYMAPEMVRGDGRAVGPWTDLYSLGCVAFALGTGLPPFAGGAPLFVMREQAKAARPPVQAVRPVPADFERWVHRLMSIDLRTRYRCAADAAFDLLRLGEPVGIAEPDPATTLIDDRTLMAPQTFLPVSESAWSTAPVEARSAPMPADWRRPDRRDARPPVLPGSGRALVGLREPRLRGRGRARAALWQGLRDVVDDGAARVALLDGPSGVGKTRLARWLGYRAHEVGAADLFVVRNTAEGGPDTGLGALLDRALRCRNLTDAARARRVRRTLGLDRGDPVALTLAAATCPTGSCADDETRVTVQGDGERVAGWIDALRRLTAPRPWVLVIDDAQWADDDTLDVVEAALRGAVPRVFFVLTTRDDVARTAASTRLAVWDRRADTVSLTLGPLSERALRRVMFDWLPLERQTADALQVRAGGSPMFAAELLLHWVRIGALRPTATGFALAREHQRAVPEAIVGVWTARLAEALAGAEPWAAEALEGAATLGTTPDPVEWKAVCAGAGLPVPESAVERLLDGRLVRAESGGRWTFAHAMVREALLERARIAGRGARWHAICADAVAVDPRRRAHHLMGAGRAEEALPLLIASAWNAWRASEDRRVRRLTVRAARAAWRAGIPSRDPHRAEIRALWSLGARGGSPKARRQAQRAAEVAGDLPPRPRARVLFARAYAATGDSDRQATGRLFTAALVAAEAADDPFLRVRCLRWLAVVHVRGGALDPAERALDTAERILDDVPVPLPAERAYVTARRVELAVARGDLESAWHYAVRARGLFGQLGHRGGLGMVARQMAELARSRGEQLAAHRLLLDARAIWFDLGRSQAVRLIDLNLGLLATEMGRYDEARRCLLAVRAGPCPAHYDVLACLVMLPGDAHRRDWAAWDAHWARIGPVLDGRLVEVDVAVAARLAARSAAAAGDDDRARAAWRLAIDQYHRLGRTAEVAAMRAERSASSTAPVPTDAPKARSPDE